VIDAVDGFLQKQLGQEGLDSLLPSNTYPRPLPETLLGATFRAPMVGGTSLLVAMGSCHRSKWVATPA
jgi:hypothetical protein